MKDDLLYIIREETLKEKLLRKKKERLQEKQQEEVKVELNDYSDDEYDTQKRFKVFLLEKRPNSYFFVPLS